MATQLKRNSKYSEAEWTARQELAACYRIFAMMGWDEMIFNHITVKVPDEEGGSVYMVPAHVVDPTPALSRLLPALYLGSDGVGNLLVVKTLTGGAQPVAVALDWEEWSEVVGTVAGDDTILIILRKAEHLETITRRIEILAGA